MGGQAKQASYTDGKWIDIVCLVCVAAIRNAFASATLTAGRNLGFNPFRSAITIPPMNTAVGIDTPIDNVRGVETPHGQ